LANFVILVDPVSYFELRGYGNVGSISLNKLKVPCLK
jgi:hypothetical protein